MSELINNNVSPSVLSVTGDHPPALTSVLISFVFIGESTDCRPRHAIFRGKCSFKM